MKGTFATAVVALLVAAPAQAASVADFYKGKIINVYSGHSKGGAYSAYARLVARHIGKHIPGNPTAVFRLKPGASGLVLAHWLHDAAPKDGVHIGTFHERITIEPMIAPKGIKFDGRDFTWLAALAKNASVCFTWGASGLKTLKDLQAKVVVAGASGTTATDAVMARMMNKTLGTKFKIISGYRGADILLALERGEVQARCGFGYPSLKTTRPDWLRDKKINIIAQLSSVPHPEIPNVPMLKDLVKPEHKAAVELGGATDVFARPYAAPPRIPAERAAALRTAFQAMVKDKNFLADAKKQNLEIDPIFGDAMSKEIDKLYKTPKAVAAQVIEFRTPLSDEQKIKRKKKKKKAE
jgi:tripartite-type tricarboxylate transporter receptor subunit TctC